MNDADEAEVVADFLERHLEAISFDLQCVHMEMLLKEANKVSPGLSAGVVFDYLDELSVSQVGSKHQAMVGRLRRKAVAMLHTPPVKISTIKPA